MACYGGGTGGSSDCVSAASSASLRSQDLQSLKIGSVETSISGYESFCMDLGMGSDEEVAKDMLTIDHLLVACVADDSLIMPALRADESSASTCGVSLPGSACFEQSGSGHRDKLYACIAQKSL